MPQVRHVNDRLGDLSSLVEVNARELLTSELADPIVPVQCEENHLGQHPGTIVQVEVHGESRRGQTPIPHLA